MATLNSTLVNGSLTINGSLTLNGNKIFDNISENADNSSIAMRTSSGLLRCKTLNSPSSTDCINYSYLTTYITANPTTSDSSSNLTSIKINGTIYKISSGSSTFSVTYDTALSVALGGIRYDKLDSSSLDDWGETRTSTSTSGNQSIAIGGSVHTYSDWDVAFGADTRAYLKCSTVTGKGNQAGPRIAAEKTAYTVPTTFGNEGNPARGEALSHTWDYGEYGDARASGVLNKAIGFAADAGNGENIAFGHYSTAKGYQNVAGGDHSTTIGSNNFASGKMSFAGGNGSIASGEGAVTFGRGTHAGQNYATSIGTGTYTNRANQLAVGEYNKLSLDGLFIVGNGNNTTRSNAFEILADGRAKIQTAPSESDDAVRLGDLSNYAKLSGSNNFSGKNSFSTGGIDILSAASLCVTAGAADSDAMPYASYSKYGSSSILYSPGTTTTTYSLNFPTTNGTIVAATNNASAVAGQVLTKTLNGSEWKDVSAGNIIISKAASAPSVGATSVSISFRANEAAKIYDSFENVVINVNGQGHWIYLYPVNRVAGKLEYTYTFISPFTEGSTSYYKLEITVNSDKEAATGYLEQIAITASFNGGVITNATGFTKTLWLGNVYTTSDGSINGDPGMIQINGNSGEIYMVDNTNSYNYCFLTPLGVRRSATTYDYLIKYPDKTPTSDNQKFTIVTTDDLTNYIALPTTAPTEDSIPVVSSTGTVTYKALSEIGGTTVTHIGNDVY